jgi:hypothetical protein
MANFCHECGTSTNHTHSAPVEVAIKTPKAKKPRKASAYSKRYGKHFQAVAPKNKLKSGSWKKGGFLRTQKAAHKLAKK